MQALQKRQMQAQMRGPQQQMRAFLRPRTRTQVKVQAAKTASGPRVAIVGITGAVGQEFLTVSVEILSGSALKPSRPYPLILAVHRGEYDRCGAV